MILDERIRTRGLLDERQHPRANQRAQLGDPSRDGWSGQLAYTYTHSAIRYSNFSNGRNVIDNLNASTHVRTLLTDLFLLDEALKISGI